MKSKSTIVPSTSYHSFLDQLGSVDQLIEIHGKLQNGRGRRHEQDAIHRAGVVMTVAAWQAYIEKVIYEVLDALRGEVNDPAALPPAPQWARHSFELRRSAILIHIKKFNTPNAANVRDLMLGAFGFDPWPSWVWQQGRRQWNEQKTRKRTDDWVKVRHTIAHGYPLPTDMDFLLGQNGNSRLTLGLLLECQKHFKYVALKTDSSVSDYLRNTYGMVLPW